MNDSRHILKRIYEITRNAISNSPVVSDRGVDFDEVTALMMAAGLSDRITKRTDDMMYFRKMAVPGLLVSIALQQNIRISDDEHSISMLRICGSYFTVESSGQVVQVIKTLFNALKDTDQIMTKVRRSKEKALRLKNLVQKSANDVIKATLRGSETQYRVVFHEEKVILDVKMPKKMVLSFDLYNKTFTEDLKKVRDIIEKMTAIMDCDCHFNLKNYGNDVKWTDSEYVHN